MTVSPLPSKRQIREHILENWCHPSRRPFTKTFYVGFLLIIISASHAASYLHTVSRSNFCQDCWPWSFLVKRLALKLESLTCTPLVPVLHSRCYKPLKLQYIQSSVYTILLLYALTNLAFNHLFFHRGVICVHFLLIAIHLLGFVISLAYRMVSSLMLPQFFPHCISFSCFLFRDPAAFYSF